MRGSQHVTVEKEEKNAGSSELSLLPLFIWSSECFIALNKVLTIYLCHGEDRQKVIENRPWARQGFEMLNFCNLVFLHTVFIHIKCSRKVNNLGVKIGIFSENPVLKSRTMSLSLLFTVSSMELFMSDWVYLLFF